MRKERFVVAHYTDVLSRYCNTLSTFIMAVNCYIRTLYFSALVFLFIAKRNLILKLLFSVVLLSEKQPYRQVYQQFLTQHVLTIADYHFPILGEISYSRPENKRLLLLFYQKIISTST